MTILIAYDGSENADHAIAVAAELFPGASAEVLYVWEPGTGASAATAVYGGGIEALDFQQDAANAVAQRGVDLALEAGLTATAATIETAGPIWRGIVDRIEELQPSVTVIGTRGLTGIRGALAGSVARAAVSHADLPVLTVPLPAKH
ncbi:unannotated protein [freshwater metagenome]|uniref:Unannotated protein n=1 Tax=freshwater metagenome TaxID=449393 RepID=A0A6J7CL95_9ZZZZ|nr:universal stress protein [Actinomycetota bacterium]